MSKQARSYKWVTCGKCGASIIAGRPCDVCPRPVREAAPAKQEKSVFGRHRILVGDVLAGLASMPDGSSSPSAPRCCVTSPPYWGLRDYGVEGQLGLESTPDEYVSRMVAVFREVRRVLADDGTLWLNIGDSYNAHPNQRKVTDKAGPKQQTNAGSPSAPSRYVDGLKPKDLVGVPWMLAFALRSDGWYLRSDIIWSKPNPMPESVTDRPTKAHEYIFLLSKSQRYYFDAEAVKEPASLNTHRRAPIGGVPSMAGKMAAAGSGTKNNDSFQRAMLDLPREAGRSARSVWTIATQAYSEAHFATFPEALPERCIRAGTSEKGKCPACGAAWTRVVERTAYGDWGRVDATVARISTGLKGDSFNQNYQPPRTVGWEPGCGCGLDPVPDVVLEPFAGSGTTLLVACRLGRDAVGCELNPQYAAMAERRIGAGLRPSTFRSDATVEAGGLFA